VNYHLSHSVTLGANGDHLSSGRLLSYPLEYNRVFTSRVSSKASDPKWNVALYLHRSSLGLIFQYPEGCEAICNISRGFIQIWRHSVQIQDWEWRLRVLFVLSLSKHRYGVSKSQRPRILCSVSNPFMFLKSPVTTRLSSKYCPRWSCYKFLITLHAFMTLEWAKPGRNLV
jgi:hypothetical protein